MKISAIILASNREEIIEDCLKSLTWVDEKILVDLGSTDKTLDIAKKYDCRIIKGVKEFNFSLWRSQGAKAAQGQWLFYVDTDERVDKKLQKEIQVQLKQSKIAAFKIPRKNYFWGKEFKSFYPDYQLRLIKKNALVKWQGKIHETPKIKGEIGCLKNPFTHLSHRSFNSSLKNTLNWSWLEAENRLKIGHPQMTVIRFFRIIFTGFYDQFVKKKIWREGIEGVIEGAYQVFSLFITYVRLWQLQKKEKGKKT